MSAITEEVWQKVFNAVREQFEIDNFLPEQETRFANFLKVKIFVDFYLSKGYSKCFIFLCLTIAADALFCSVFWL